MAPKAYTVEFFADLDRTVTRARIFRYLAATQGDLTRALTLYEMNIAVSEALFGVLHSTEIAIRNSLHSALSAGIGTQDWYRNNLALPFPTVPRLVFTRPMQKMVEKARRNVGTPAPVGKLIAELTFGFWPFLISSQYHDLWSVCSHHAFPHARLPRSRVHTRLETIQRLRNRIAHHEPILSSHHTLYTGNVAQPHIALSEILECVRWISPATADWVRDTTRYDRAQALLAEISASGIVL
jgi:hypothetical protein